MFAYCGNNPVNRIDPTGHFFSEIWEFAKIAVAEIGKAISAMSPAYAACGGAAVADGPLPFGDAIGFIGAAAITIGAAGYGIYQATKAPSTSISKAEEKEKDIALPTQPKAQAYFIVNPYNFHPKGLVRKEFAGSYNGRIIEWRDPISNIKVFEWNEDFQNGEHYHALLIEWDVKHDLAHYKPGTPVPEPWNSLYFGG